MAPSRLVVHNGSNSQRFFSNYVSSGGTLGPEELFQPMVAEQWAIGKILSKVLALISLMLVGPRLWDTERAGW